MPAKRRASRLVWLRRAVQTLSLLLFTWLFLDTAPHALNQPGIGEIFFNIDPLLAFGTWIASHAFIGGMIAALATIAVTAVFGRWFCGWICPFGALHQFFSSLRGASAKEKMNAAVYSPWLKAKYYVLAACLGAALCGANLAGWLDPLSFLFRTLTTAVFPALQYAVSGFFGWIYEWDPHLGSAHLTAATEPVYAFLRAHLLAPRQPYFFGGALIGFLFAAALALNFLRPRFWCRYICPLGALLGIVGSKPRIRLRRRAEGCNDCRLCAADCQGGADPHGKWNAAECLYCLNCRSDCPSAAIELTARRTTVAPLNLGRRRLIASGVAGAGAALTFRTGAMASGRSFNPDLVRPPGSLAEADFLSRCLRCGECMRVCPTNAVHPAGLEAGLDGVWTPVMKMTAGYCDYECTLCSQVCPSGAIRPLTVAAKQKVKIGIAYIDRNRCLPYAYGRACIVCEEHCPTPKKAIRFEEAEVVAPSGERVIIKQPRVDPELCIGCGICVAKCVVKSQPAVLVASAGETRNPGNQFLLRSE